MIRVDPLLRVLYLMQNTVFLDSAKMRKHDWIKFGFGGKQKRFYSFKTTSLFIILVLLKVNFDTSDRSFLIKID